MTRMRTMAIALAAAAAMAFAGCAGAPAWQGWSEKSQRQYFGLSCVAGDSVLVAYRSQADREAMEAWYQAYWATDHGGVSYQEHQRRLDFAWTSFGGTRCFRDDRARTYMLYGEPTDRWTSHEPWRYLDTKRLAGGGMFRHRPWEVWQYPYQGLYFDFIEFHEVYRSWAMLRLDRRHPIAFFDTCSALPATPPPAPATEAPIRPLEYRWARFKSATSPEKVRWELYWRVPVATVGDGRAVAVFSLADHQGRRTVDTLHYRIVVPADSLLEPYAYGQRNLDLPPSHYRMEIEVRTSDAVFRAQTETELVAYRPGVKECSDVELALLQDTTRIADDFKKGKYLRVVPYVSEDLPPRQPYFVYYEVYNLSTDARGEHHVAVRLQAFQGSGEMLTERPFAAGEFTAEAPGDEFHGCHCIYPHDLGEAETYLVINVDDLLSGRTTKLVRSFWMKRG